MDYSRFIIMLARQRSGTNAIRSAMESHPDLFCINAVFNIKDMNSSDEMTRRINYFNFLKDQARIDPARILPDHHEQLFTDFLTHLAGLTTKRYIMIDVKLNTTHLMTQPWMPLRAMPYLFTLMLKLGIRPFLLTRKNYLRYVLSLQKAKRSGEYSWTAEKADSKIRINVQQMMHEIQQCHDEDSWTKAFFPPRAKPLVEDYANIFTSGTESMNEGFRQKFCGWLGIADQFASSLYFKKQSSLTLEETIENYDEVAGALRGTAFEYCLQDENIYRATTTPTPEAISQ